MNQYQHILVAIDLSEEAHSITDKAIDLAQTNNAKVSILHVVEPIGLSFGTDIPVDFTGVEKEIRQHTQQLLQEFAEKHSIAEPNHHLAFGQAEREIHRFAEQQEVDLIVVGSHGRHGLALLLGSTANGVLHGAPCDVLAVRVQ